MSGVAFFMEMGTGKSLCAASVFNLMGVHRGLIICPVSVVGVWPREFRIHSEKEFNIAALRSESGKSPMAVSRKAKLAEKALESDEDTIIICNYESAWRDPLASILKSTEWDLVVLDECHRIKNRKSKISKFAHKLAPKAKNRLILTGTEIGNSPLDVFSQYRFLNDSVFGTRWDSFEKRYAITDAWGNPSRLINQDDMRTKIDSIAYRATKAVLTDLPDTLHIEIPTPLSGEAARMYKEVMDGMWATLDAETSAAVIARVVIAQLTRCAQITGGHVGGIIDLNNPGADPQVRRLSGTTKQEALEDILSSLNPTTEPVVVFARFSEELSIIKECAEKYGFRYGEISGKSKSGLNADSKMAEDCDLVGVQLQAGGVGIDLTKSSICIYWSTDFSYQNYAQSLARTHRPGQKNKVKYYHFITPDTVDEEIHQALESKENVADWYKEKARKRQEELRLGGKS